MTADLNPAGIPQLLFDYIRDVIYDPKHAHLDIQALDEDYRDLGEGLACFAGQVTEARAFADAMARGDLKASIPGKDNELASSLKAMHASLRHMTWQTQQVAKGDYKQRIDFMGEFSEAFNTMIEQLDARQKALEKEIETSRQKNRALQAAGSLVANITENTPRIIVVLSEDTEQVRYTNHAGQTAIEQDPKLLLRLQGIPNAAADTGTTVDQVTTKAGAGERHYEVQSYALQWEDQNARAYVVEEVSDRQARVKRLEKLANWDELTRLNNRHFGMATLQKWLEEDRAFTLCFLDLDNLKYINDTFGHTEGDAYIRRAADLLRGVKENTVACRVGGDEFMLLVPDIGEAEAAPLLEALSRDFNENDAENRPYDANISYGVVEVRPGCGLSAGNILSLADERMYRQKREYKRQRGAAMP